MSKPRLHQPRIRSETEQGLDELVALHAARPFVLAGRTNRERMAHLDGDPVGLVDELLRLASIGAALEAIEADYGRRPLSDALHTAKRSA